MCCTIFYKLSCLLFLFGFYLSTTCHSVTSALCLFPVHFGPALLLLSKCLIRKWNNVRELRTTSIINSKFIWRIGINHSFSFSLESRVCKSDSKISKIDAIWNGHPNAKSLKDDMHFSIQGNHIYPFLFFFPSRDSANSIKQVGKVALYF